MCNCLRGYRSTKTHENAYKYASSGSDHVARIALLRESQPRSRSESTEPQYRRTPRLTQFVAISLRRCPGEQPPRKGLRLATARRAPAITHDQDQRQRTSPMSIPPLVQVGPLELPAADQSAVPGGVSPIPEPMPRQRWLRHLNIVPTPF